MAQEHLEVKRENMTDEGEVRSPKEKRSTECENEGELSPDWHPNRKV
jgi:hypothetical protein